MTAPHLASCVAYRGHSLGVAEQVTCWMMTRAGRVGNAALVDFAEHMRDALARVGDKGMTLKEAKRIAKLARMGEEWSHDG